MNHARIESGRMLGMLRKARRMKAQYDQAVRETSEILDAGKRTYPSWINDPYWCDAFTECTHEEALKSMTKNQARVWFLQQDTADAIMTLAAMLEKAGFSKREQIAGAMDFTEKKAALQAVKWNSPYDGFFSLTPTEKMKTFTSNNPNMREHVLGRNKRTKNMSNKIDDFLALPHFVDSLFSIWEQQFSDALTSGELNEATDACSFPDYCLILTEELLKFAETIGVGPENPFFFLMVDPVIQSINFAELQHSAPESV